jgi:dGTPase
VPDAEQLLAPYAARESSSKGRRHAEPRSAYRGEYQRDRDRIVHCTAFRRLMYKTQVFVNHEGDLYRTRLTHSLEVAQIARTVCVALKLNESLVEAISLAHDLGHTPFGHAGQDSLNACMRDYGGFEHNLQSLRVVDELEAKYADFPGLNLTFETREGILKHCSARNAKTLGDVGERFLSRQQPGAEAQVANIADAIAYNNHDVDDGIRAGLLTVEQLADEPLFADQYQAVRKKYPDIEDRRFVYEIIRRMINHVVSDLIVASGERISALRPQDIADIRAAGHPVVAFSDAVYEQHVALKKFLMANFYKHEKVQDMTGKARTMVATLFAAYIAEPEQMPAEFSQAAAGAERTDQARVVADYVAGMTDRFAIREYQRLA